uniref:Ig-like domain-containing protein n=2 Tax=Astatotilapia calliptera TaxID=8154 RepID=A0AAX7VTN2_ASTCA
MSAVTSAFICWTLLSVCLSSAVEEVILGQTGMTIALPCQVPSNNNPIVAVEWSRRDLEPEYVLFYRDNKLVPDYQHPSFKNRVDLKDRQMKGGDVSLILKDVKTDDSGAYECYVVQKGANHSKTTSLDGYYIRATYLTVSLQNHNNNIIIGGDTATLECQAPNSNDPIIAAFWIRPDLEPEYVHFYQDDEIDTDYQHPSFKNRVDLKDRQMKGGDVSLILKDVTADDSGLYVCYVDQRKTKRASLYLHPISITYLTVVPPNQKNITVDSGQNVILPCRVPLLDLKFIMVVVWKRTDLGEEYVLSYQNQRFHPENQHPSFKNRVDLQDRQMKNGDVSLILKDVTTDDAGAYECHVVQRESLGWEIASPKSRHISTIYLSVVPSNKKIIIAVMGQTVTLPCQALSSNNPIIAAEWSRVDLEPKYVLYYQDYKLFPDYHQHPSFKNRVHLKDRKMKDKDMSLILKNVTINDTGTYECYVAQRGVNRRKRASLDSYPISTTYLSVLLQSQKNISAESGQNVTLTCRAPNTVLIPGVEWSRRDLKAQYVFWYWEKEFVSYYQHPSFKNRVDLQDRQMKDGVMSLILKDVTTADSGTYECCIIQEVRDGRKIDILKTDPISIIHLKVIPKGQPGGHGEDGAVGLKVVIVLLLVSFASIIYYIKMTQ